MLKNYLNVIKESFIETFFKKMLSQTKYFQLKKICNKNCYIGKLSRILKFQLEEKIKMISS